MSHSSAIDDSRREPSIVEFDNQLWPIVVVILLVAGIAAAIVCQTQPLPNPLEQNWLTLAPYRTGWGGLGVIAVLLTVALGAVMWLQRVVARRILFSVLVGLLVHVLLGVYLHHQFLAILLQQQVTRDDQEGKRPQEQAIPDYHWQTLDMPQTRQDFEKPLRTERPELTERIEVEKLEPREAPRLEPEPRQVEVERQPTALDPALIERQRVEREETPTPLTMPRAPSAMTREPNMEQPTVEAPAPRETLATRPLDSNAAPPIDRRQPATAGQTLPPRSERPMDSPPRTVDVALPAMEPARPSRPTVSTTPILPESATRPTWNRSMPLTPPAAFSITMTPIVADTARSETEHASAALPETRPFEMAEVGPLQRQTGRFAEFTAASRVEGGAPVAAASSFGDTSAAHAAPVALPTLGQNGNAVGAALSTEVASLQGAGIPRADRMTDLLGRAGPRLGTADADPGDVVSTGGLGGDRADAPGDDFAGSSADLAALSGVGSTTGLGRRESMLDGLGPLDTRGTRPDATAGAAVGASSGATAGGVEIAMGGLAARPANAGGPVSLDGLAMHTHVPRATAPGLGRAPLGTRISDSPGDRYWQRQPQFREQLAIDRGGSPETERAVELALAYFARQQMPDGRWALDRFPNSDGPEYARAAPGEMHADTAATGLALLAFLGAGYTHEDGQYRAVVRRGIDWLVSNQGADGRLYSDHADRTVFARTYGHGIAAIALCEAYGMTRDPALRVPAERAVAFIVMSQHPELGGWRYSPRMESDTSVSGWQLMALTSGRLAGIDVPRETLTGVSHWLDLAQFYEGTQYAYNPLALDDPTQRHGRQPNLPMTAQGLLMRFYLGATRDEPTIRSGAAHLSRNLPAVGTVGRPTRDVYYWYLATQVMFQMQGEAWDGWNARMRPTILAGQIAHGELSGSWDPDRPAPDRWAQEGGRHYVTAMHCLMLEVYYRYLPIFDMLDD